MELGDVAKAAAPYGEVSGVLAAETAGGERSYLVAFESGGTRDWLLLDAAGNPVDERVRAREVASLVAMCELAAEHAGAADEARVASPAFLDATGTSELAPSMSIVEAFVDEVEKRYRLPLR
jgi:hypothetical protein